MLPIKDDQPRYSTPYVNTFLIVLNILIFFYEWTLGPRAGTAFLKIYGEVPSHLTAFLTGSPRYTLPEVVIPFFTSMFLHGGWMHVLGNMWFLYIFGDNVEDYLGHFKYLLFYITAGLLAMGTQVSISPHSNVPTVGASGAIAGVMGAYVLLYPRAKVLTLVVLIVFFTFWWIPSWVFLGYWFLVQFFFASVTVHQASGGVAFGAHVGGFLTGLILIKVFPRRTRAYRYGS